MNFFYLLCNTLNSFSRVNPDNTPDGYSTPQPLDSATITIIIVIVIFLIFLPILFGVISIIKDKKANEKLERKLAASKNASITENQQPQHATTTGDSSEELELKKYKRLLDEGLITQEEFNKKKKQILGL